MKEHSHNKHKAGHDAPPQEAPAASAPAPEAAAPAPAAPAEEPLRAQLLRLQADFDNFRKRTQREKSEWAQQSTEALMQELLPVLDHYELGLQTAVQQSTAPSVIQGFQMVLDQLQNALAKFGLSPLTTEGQAFDPHQHEAIAHLASPEVPDGQVLTQTRKGYRLGERLLRPARVVVSSGPPEAPAAEGAE